MTTILSLAADDRSTYAAGPDGLFRVEGAQLVALPQPMESLYCVVCAAGSLLVGGAPHGTAWRREDGTWQGSWMDSTRAPVVAIAAAASESDRASVLIAGTTGDGILRSTDAGRSWTVCNFGLHEFTVLSVAWAPESPPQRWPRREIAFCGTERAIYRSPADALGWSHVVDVGSAVQAIAVSPRFHEDRLVLAGSEESGLWRSCDAGRVFTQVEGLPSRIDSLLAGDESWLAATPDGVWRSDASAGAWERIAGSPAALCLVQTKDGTMVGGIGGVARLGPSSEPV